MARRKPDSAQALGTLLQNSPTWMGPALAVGGWLLGYVALPAMLRRVAGQLPLEATLIPLARLLSWLLAGFILFVWLIVTIKKISAGKDLKNHEASIREMSWGQFEEHVAEVFRRQGYYVERTGAAGGDGGIDLVLERGKAKTLVQCKHWKAWKVAAMPVRELLGVVTAAKAEAGILLTSGEFTSEARAFAAGTVIRLVDGPELSELVQSVVFSTQDRPAPVATLQRSASLPAVSPAAPTCPKCGQTMVRRVAKQGTNAGQAFWGCPAYPSCRGTRRI